MQTFIYKITKRGAARGYDKCVTVYRILNSRPVFVGHDREIQEASTKGPYAVACGVISTVLGYRLSKGSGNIGSGYSLERKDVQLFEV